jgi:hypothetical protein
MGVCVGDYENCGSRAAFYILDGERGFKEFETEEDAQYAHYVQSKLSQYNLAPKVLSDIGKIRFRHDMVLSNWGYITEIAEVIGCGGNDCSCGECEDIFDNKTKSNQLTRLLNKIEDLGLEFMDAHVGNVGYVKRNGKKVLVCIDCGQESVYDPDVDDNYLEDDCGCEQCKARRYQNV